MKKIIINMILQERLRFLEKETIYLFESKKKRWGVATKVNNRFVWRRKSISKQEDRNENDGS